jgi:hypothetical protein
VKASHCQVQPGRAKRQAAWEKLLDTMVFETSHQVVLVARTTPSLGPPKGKVWAPWDWGRSMRNTRREGGWVAKTRELQLALVFIS